VAGLGYSTLIADLDFETYSEAGFVWDGQRERWVCLPRASQGKKGIAVVGAARYVEHPTAEVLSLAYDLYDGRGRRHWKPGEPPPADLFDHIARGGLLRAWNVGFERWVWWRICVARMGWPPVPADQWRCAMAAARAFNLPGSLEKAGEVLGAATQKDKRGKQLLDRFSIPRNPTLKDRRLRIPVVGDPEEQGLYDYNGTDIEAQADIAARVPDLPPGELRNWQLDQTINSRGVQVDMAAVRDCIVVVEEALARYDAELTELTGGVVTAASQVAKLTGWLNGRGCPIYSLTEEDVKTVLAREGIPADARRALEIRQAAGSASVKKLFAIANQVTADDRLHDLYTYHGARTGRRTGNGPQPMNLPSGGPDVARCEMCGKHFGRTMARCAWCGSDLARKSPVRWVADPAVVKDALATMRHRSFDVAASVWGDPLPVISGCLRGLFVARPGHDLICSDYSAIEAVVVAELAGETWRQEVFRGHAKIYEASASKVTGRPVEFYLEHRKTTGNHHPDRKLGKVLELALAYGGWTGALKAFGAGEFMTEDEMAEAAGAWRRASPAIVALWGGQTDRRGMPHMHGLEGAAIGAVIQPGQEFHYRGMSFLMRGDVLYFRLLSGRYLVYHRPRLRPSDRRAGEFTLSYETWNTNPKYGPIGWVRLDTYGPKLAENASQATARDIEWTGIQHLEAAGYPVVMDVYDEVITEVPEGWGSVDEQERLMTTLPIWAAGWPIRAAGGWRGKRYRKDD
jgi:DNA polymerase